MDDLENEIKRLSERTARTRYEILNTELQTCRMALEMANYELLVGNAATAKSEAEFVGRGIAALYRFLPLTSEEQQLEIGKKLSEMEAALDSVNAKLNQGVQ